jgi:hypothetical protein
MDQKKNKTAGPVKKAKSQKKKVNRKVAKILNKDNLASRRLLMMNPYAQTLLDPFNVRGVRIPDDAQYPSVPFTIVDRQTITVNAQGVAMICYGLYSSSSIAATASLIPISITGTNSGASYQVGMIGGTAASTTDLTAGVPGTTGVSPIRFAQWSAATPTVQTSFEKVRLVSAGLNVQFTGNYTHNSGKYTIAYGPRGHSRAQGGNAFPLAYLAQFPESRTVPISLNEGATIRYEPVDEYSFRYTLIGANNTSYIQAYPIVTSNDWEDQVAQAEGGELWCAVDGSDSGTTFQCTFVANYEGIVTSNSFLLASAAQSSVSDPIALTHALRVSESAPNVQSGSYEANSTAMNTIDQAKEMSFHPSPPGGSESSPQMFDQLLSMISRGSDVVKDVSGVVEKIAPFAAGALALL